jgi:hypothetical protein
MTILSPYDVDTGKDMPVDNGASPSNDVLAREQRARNLLRLLQLSEVAIWVDATGLHARPLASLHQQIRDEMTDLKPELTELLKTEGVEDVFSIPDPIEETHKLNTTPTPAPEAIDADARKARMKAAQRREYQNGTVVVSPVDAPSNNFGHHVKSLVALRDRKQPGPRSWAPHPGTCNYRWNLFDDDGPTAE